jgi:hypothetical protein
MNTSSLPGGTPKGAHLVTREGRKLLAHTAGQKHPVDITDPSIHHHLATDAHFQDGKGGPMVPIHKAYHTAPHTLPPALVKLIEAAIQNYLQTQDLHAAGAPPPPMGMPAPGGPMPPAAAPPGLPGSL